MNLQSSLSHFGAADLAALTLTVCVWLGIGWRIENPAPGNPSVAVLMVGFRREWMRQFVAREARMFDAAIMANLRQGTSFFASACMIAIGGGLALIGNTERLLGLAQDLTFTTAPAIVWEVKILFVLLFLTNSFLKFVWAHRLFGYCAIIMAAAPNDPAHPDAALRTEQAAEVNISAARNFNRGMRSIYFALGALAWLVGSWALIGATVLTASVLWRREFASQSRRALLRGTPM
ncbi:MAG: DUF599 domain-containing protein [Rhodobacteraceae bacterium]|uniref:DUF599 domain-containing protein n=1 Tax=Albidovulum sp. TaxID=1872424 RepID=UPI001DE135B1|nr:DUF599 domain-containing protein [Paracoccaceae bacterium]MCC0045175.1 DUF599 domain-containing protein [Defluviimonas sp.]HPE25146.1 DUF599 domain-containing protein [Albidovulum sp.]MCB2119217.1 DUF599 domain-containing protein [Paracoccaceae bacterium]MCB2122427.1 DUF599 domain-containing protein [Paracoccaceae bacterium]